MGQDVAFADDCIGAAATAVVNALEDGQVALDDTVAERLPGLVFDHDPDGTADITMHHLISHQGGFQDWLDWAAAPDDDLLATYTYGDYGTDSHLQSPAGAMWNYSNPNFTLAGLVTEELDDGRYWPDILREDLFQPLGMARSTSRKSEVEADGDYALGVGYDASDFTYYGRLDIDRTEVRRGQIGRDVDPVLLRTGEDGPFLPTEDLNREVRQGIDVQRGPTASRPHPQVDLLARPRAHALREVRKTTEILSQHGALARERLHGGVSATIGLGREVPLEIVPDRAR